MLLPARMAVLNQLSKVKKLSISEAMEDLTRDYGQAGQFNSSAYLEHFMSLEANGFAELVDYQLTKDGNLELFYSITEDGKASVEKYISQKFR